MQCEMDATFFTFPWVIVANAGMVPEMGISPALEQQNAVILGKMLK